MSTQIVLYYTRMTEAKQSLSGDKNKVKYSVIAIFILFSLLFLVSGSFSVVSSGKKLIASVKIIISEEKNKPAFDYSPVFINTEQKPVVSALSYLGAYLGENDKTIILAEKNSDDLLPMASITKLMTAIVAYKNYDLNDKVAIGPKVNDWTDSSKRFIPGTIFKISELLHALLIESNNDVAMALAWKIGMDNFLAEMNGEAKKMGIITTHYDNPVGLDPTSKKEIINYSTAKELLVLTKEIIKNYPQILEITSIPQYNIKTDSGGYNHTAINTDKFLSDENEKLLCQGNPLKILGGKTGSTDLAKKNLVLVMESPNEHGYLITIILSADDNFSETKNLAKWLCESYTWPKPAENILQNGVY